MYTARRVKLLIRRHNLVPEEHGGSKREKERILCSEVSLATTATPAGTRVGLGTEQQDSAMRGGKP